MTTSSHSGKAGSVTTKQDRSRRLIDRIIDLLPGPLGAAADRARGSDIILLAAALAFYALVSIAPLLILVMWIASAIVGDDTIHNLARQLEQQAPKSLGVGHAVMHVAELGTSLGLPALITGLWPASAYGSGLSRSFHRLSKSRKELEGLRGRGIVLVALLPLFVLGGLIGSYIGTTFLDGDGLEQAIGIVLALATGFLGVAGAIALIYRIYPRERLEWPAILKGTLFASAGVSIVSAGLTAYLTFGADFQQHYASSGLAGVVLLALWLFCSNALILMGYQLAIEEG